MSDEMIAGADATEIANSAAAATGTGEPTEPVEVELTGDELKDVGVAGAEGEGTDPAAGEGAPKTKPKKRADNRVATATARAAAAEDRAASLADENARLRREMAAANGKAQTADAAAMEHYEAAVKNEVELAERQLADAESSGDAAAKAAATRKLATASAKQAQIDTWKSAQPKPAAKPAPDPAPRQPAADPAPRQAAPQFEPTTAAWLQENNDWFNPQSRGFDEDMHTEAVLFARKLERAGTDPESEEYWNKIDAHIREEFPDRFEGEAAPATRRAPAMSGGGKVAAPTRSAGTPGRAAASPTKVTLSPDERKLAHNLASSGAITGPGGKRLSPAEAEKAFAIQKLQTRKSA